MKRHSRNCRLAKALLVVLAALGHVSGFAVERTYTGATDGEFGVPGNWSGSTLPGDGDTAVIPGDTTVKVSTSASVAALKAVSFVRLDGATAKLELSDVSVDFDGGKPRLFGTGTFSAKGTLSTPPTVSLRQDNGDFAGSFFFSDVAVSVYGPRSVGGQSGGNVCPVSHVMTKATATYSFKGGGNYYNPIASNTGSTWYGLRVDSATDSVITNFGSIVFTCSGDAGTRISMMSPYDFVQRGAITLSKNNFDAACGGNGGRLWLDCDVTLPTNDAYIFNDSSSGGTVVFGPSFRLLRGSKIQSQANNKIAFGGDNVFAGTTVGCNLLSASSVLDLNGHSQVFPNYLYTAKGCVVTSANAPATLTLKGYFNNSTASCNADLNGHVSLELDTANATVMSIFNGEGKTSQTDGSLIVTRGTLKATEGLNMPNIQSIVIGAEQSEYNAKLNIFSTSVTINPSVTLAHWGVGRLELASGMTLKVASATDDGLPMAKGKYAQNASEGIVACPWIDGDGVLEICGGSIEQGDFVWCGAAGAAWSDASNWKVDGVAAGRVPGSGDRAVIADASEVFVGDDDLASVNALSGLLLLVNDSVLTLTNVLTEANLSLSLSGAGKFRGVNVGYDGTSTLKTSIVFSGDNSDFHGSFYFTNTSVQVANAKGLGTDNSVVFWGQNGYTGTQPILKYAVSGEFDNTLWLHNGGSGLLNVDGECAVTNRGTVNFYGASSVVRIRTAGLFAFGGAIVNKHSRTGLSGGNGLNLNGRCAVVGSAPQIDAKAQVYADGGAHYWERPVKNISNGFMFAGADGDLPSLTFGAANIDVDCSMQLWWNPEYNPVRYDLNGFDQRFLKYACYNLGKNRELVLTSSTGPATLTLKGDSGTTRVPAVKYDGEVSLAIESSVDGATVSLSNRVGEVSATTGAMMALAGTMQFNAGTRLPNLSKLIAGKSGSESSAILRFADADVVVNRNADIEFAGVGKVDLPDGYRLSVKHAKVNGVDVTPGTYSASSPDSAGLLNGRILGLGVISVRGDGMILFLE